MSLPVWGALAVFWPHWVCPHSWRRCYTAQAPGCSIGSGPWVVCSSSFWVLHKSADSVGPAFCAFPAQAAQAARSLTGALSPGAVRLLPSAVPASVSTCSSWVPLVSVLGSWSLAVTLPVDVNHQNLRKSVVRNWESVRSLVGDAASGGEFAPFPSPLPPASGGGWAGLPLANSSLELLSLSFVPKQCRPLLSVQPPLAGGGSEHLGYFSAGSCF